MTKQRQLIHDIIYKSCDHLTAESIHKLAQKKMPSIAVGTVYRNLGLMCDSGEIMRVTVAGEPDRFDKNPIYHDHIICDTCGAVSDISTDGLMDVLCEKTGLPVDSYDLTVHYICDKCRNSKNI
ncbi:MAG: transcriptional repressor [Ruminococcaceae bacterium]|nr:transcriptional repressor [Oscillospiraceae bacterium]